jgi:hypothetical protein
MYLQASPDQRHKATRYPRLRADVGRGQRLAAPGLVVTVFNWARPRDLSHYETFEQFHATLYRHVEALSVTPFADRAIDRGLTGVLVSLVRNLSERPTTAIGGRRRSTRASNSPTTSCVTSSEGRRTSSAIRPWASAWERHLDARLDEWNRQRRASPVVASPTTGRPDESDDVAGLLRRPEQRCGRS